MRLLWLLILSVGQSWASTAVLIHGCHLHVKNWEEIVFWSEQAYGRVLTAVQEALSNGAELLIWGSGASSKDGLVESQWAFQKAVGECLPEIARIFFEPPEKLKECLQRISFIDLHTKNTADEICLGLQLCQERGIDKLILISSPTHIARCLQESCKQNHSKKIAVYARASDTCYERSSSGDVVIVEPPHRPDRPQLPVHLLVKKMIPFFQSEEHSKQFYLDLADLLAYYERYTRDPLR